MLNAVTIQFELNKLSVIFWVGYCFRRSFGITLITAMCNDVLSVIIAPSDIVS